LELIRKINVHSVQKSMKNVDKKENFVEKRKIKNKGLKEI
jgi:hypothetical protein